MRISMIAAVAENYVIGKDNDLVWQLPDDMKYFMETTKGHCVLMGRRNWESIPHKYQPLPHRTNMVMSRSSNISLPEGVHLVNTMKEALNIARELDESEFFIIGGGEIYNLGLPYADRLYITEVNATPEGDSYFPRFNISNWREVSREHHPANERHAHSFDFVVYDRK